MRAVHFPASGSQLAWLVPGFPHRAPHRASGCGLGGRLGLALIDRARGQVTRSATFWEPGPRWLSRPGAGPNREPGGTELSGNKVAARGQGRVSGETTNPTSGIHGSWARLSLLETRAPSQGAGPTRQRPTLALQQRGRQPRLGGPGGGAVSSSRAQSCGVAFPRRRGAGSARRGISPAQGRGGGAGFLSRSGDLGERRPFSFRWFLRTENSSQRAPSPGLPFRLFCFWRNYPAGRLHKPGGVSSPVSIFSPLLDLVWLSTFHLKKKKSPKFS